MNQNYKEWHLTPVQMGVIKKSTNEWCRGCGEKGTLIHCLWKGKLAKPVWKKHEAPYQTKNKNTVTIRSSNPPPGDISGKAENCNSKRHTHLNVHGSTVHNSQDIKQPKLSLIDECIKKM